MANGVRIAGVWRTVLSAWVRTGGAWRQVPTVRVRVGGLWKDAKITPDMALSSAWTNVSGASPQQTNLGRTITVPAGSSGVVKLTFSILSGSPSSFEYDLNVAGYVAYLNNQLIAATNGNTIRIRMTGAACSATVNLVDNVTGAVFATCTVTNT
jgi:hypothetical protein